MNRISCANENPSTPVACAASTGNWARTYGYDPWANGWVSNNTGLITNSFTPTASTNFDGANHLLTGGASYSDPSNILTGNQTVIGAYTLTYDAENRVSSSAINSNTTTYVYDGNGHRVMKSTGTAATTYVYDAMNQLIAEYGTPSAVDTGTKYVSVDHLGSTRLVTDTSSPTPNQEICYDFLPFGELIPSGTDGRSGCYGSTATPLTQKFTGQERDVETNNDFFQARYLSAYQGRFTSPDPLGNFVANAADPQSWNMYAYVENNPMAFVDPSGLACVYEGADNGTAADYADPTNYVDDDNPGQTCAQAFSSPPEEEDVAASWDALPTYDASVDDFGNVAFSIDTFGSPIATSAPGTTPTNAVTCSVSASSLNSYLGSKRSPLVGQGANLMSSGSRYNLDPRLFVALSGAETTFGRNITAGANNAFNVLYSGHNSPFNSFASAINSVGHSLTNPRNNYNLSSTNALYSTYCHGACSDGLKNLNRFMLEQQASPTALHFPCQTP